MAHSQKSLFNYIFAFITGFVILAVEITLLKVVAPYAGSDIFSTSIVINGVLLALAFGYWLGGKYSSLHHGVLGLIAASYLLLSSVLHPYIGRVLVVMNPHLIALIIVMLLFFIPMLLAGMITPLLTDNLKRLGTARAAGRIFAIGTAGSIMGGLLTPLFFMPLLGIVWTLIFASMSLFVISVLSILPLLLKKKQFFILIAIPLLIVSVGLAFSSGCYYSVGECLFETQTPYGTYTVSMSENGRVYSLLNGLPQSVSIDSETGKTGYYYDIFAQPNFHSSDKVLILGNGVGVAMTLINQKNPSVSVTGVEIDPLLTDIGERWFDLDTDINHLVHADARVFVNRDDTTYEYIFIDLYEGFSVPSHLLTAEFFQAVKKRLADNGLVVINIPHYVNHEAEPNKRFKELYFNTILSVFSPCVYDPHMHVMSCSKDVSGENIFSTSNNIFMDDFPLDVGLQSKAYYAFTASRVA